MIYYRRYLADYLRDTPRLSLLEHGAYTLLLDYYYAEEKPLPTSLDEIFRMVRAITLEERAAVEKVLKLYFSNGADAYHHKRADHEIYVSKKARENGAKGGRPVTEQLTGLETTSITRSGTGQAPGSGHPSAFNHQPSALQPSEAGRTKGVRLPADWKPDEKLKDLMSLERPDLDIDKTVEKFRDYWIAVPGTRGRKLDWEATFRNWVREERKGTATAKPPTVEPKPADLCGHCKKPFVGGYTVTDKGKICRPCRKDYMDGKWS